MLRPFSFLFPFLCTLALIGCEESSFGTKVPVEGEISDPSTSPETSVDRNDDDDLDTDEKSRPGIPTSSLPGKDMAAPVDDGIIPGDQLPVAMPKYYQKVVESLQTEKEVAINILFVIDDSGSMKNDQDDLARNLPILVNELAASGQRLRFGVTTTDVAKSFRKGALVAPPVEIDSLMLEQEKEDLIEQLKRDLRVGTNGSGKEQGIKATQLSIENQSEWNREFFHDDFSLEHFAVIVVSDEDEMVGGFSNRDVRRNYLAFYQAQLRILPIEEIAAGLKEINDSGLMNVFHAIIQMEDHFMFPSGHIFAYQKLAESMGGNAIELKGPFGEKLQIIADDINERISQVSLKQKPAEEKPIKLIINGVESADFTFDPEKNLVIIGPELPPLSLVEVEYFVLSTEQN